MNNYFSGQIKVDYPVLERVKKFLAKNANEKFSLGNGIYYLFGEHPLEKIRVEAKADFLQVGAKTPKYIIDGIAKIINQQIIF
jgi:hypothetical protein